MARRKPKPITAYMARRYLCEISCMREVLMDEHPDLPPALFAHLMDAYRILADVFEAAPGKEDL